MFEGCCVRDELELKLVVSEPCCMEEVSESET